MAEDAVKAEPATTTISRTAALLAFAGAAMFAVLLAALHFIKPELDPSWHFISEYAFGNYGWMMVLAFLSFAISYVSLFVAIRSQVRTIVGKIGLSLLLVSALGLTVAAVFTTDPMTVSEDAVTTEGTLHNLGGTLGSAMPFAAGLVGWKLVRNPAWSSAKRRRIRPRCAGRMAQPVRGTGLQCVADGSGKASDPGERRASTHRGGLTLVATAGTYVEANGQRRDHEQPE